MQFCLYLIFEKEMRKSSLKLEVETYFIFNVRVFPTKAHNVFIHYFFLFGEVYGQINSNFSKTAWWSSGRASDSESRDPVFDPHLGYCVVSLSKTH